MHQQKLKPLTVTSSSLKLTDFCYLNGQTESVTNVMSLFKYNPLCMGIYIFDTRFE